MDIVIITGMSGAGKTKAVDWFEDHGYYCIDNMPPQLIKSFLELSTPGENPIDKVAFVADIRSGGFFESLGTYIDELKTRDDINSTVLFMQASSETLVRRYNETRRSHPFGGRATVEIIESERQMLETMRERADVIIDTTGLKTSELYAEMNRIFLSGDKENAFVINLISFGYKYGIPTESDIQIDVRFIPNPYYVKSLKNLTGNNKKVSHYVLKFPITQQFIANFTDMINKMIPGYLKEGKYHLNIAIGCTGGHHRSVAVVNELARIFTENGDRVTVTHRDLDFVNNKKL